MTSRLKQIVRNLWIPVVGLVGAYGFYWVTSRMHAAGQIRVGVGNIAAKWDGGLMLDLGIDIDNPTDVTVNLESIDLVASYKGKDIGKTIPKVLETDLKPNAVTRINVLYSIPLMDLISTVFTAVTEIIDIIPKRQSRVREFKPQNRNPSVFRLKPLSPDPFPHMGKGEKSPPLRSERGI